MVAIHGRQCRDDRASTDGTTPTELDKAELTEQGADHITVNSRGEIFVADTLNWRILKYVKK
jgi:hypothetical protein